MKKVIFFMAFGILSFCQVMNAQICDAITAQVLPMNPQPSGENYDYYGVRVNTNITATTEINVQGYIHDQASISSGIPFQLTIYPGNTEAQTATDFFQIERGTSVVVTIASVFPCPLSSFTPEEQSVNFINWIDFNVNYLINNNFQDYGNIEAIKNIMANNVNSFYSTYSITPPPDPDPVILSHNSWMSNKYDSLVQLSFSEEEFMGNLGAFKSQINSNALLSTDEKQVYSAFVDLIVMLVQYCNSKLPDDLTYTSRSDLFDLYNRPLSKLKHPFQYASFSSSLMNKNPQYLFRSWWSKWGRCVFGTIGSSWMGQITACGTGGGIGAGVGGIHGAIAGCGAGLVVGSIAGTMVGIATFC